MLDTDTDYSESQAQTYHDISCRGIRAQYITPTVDLKATAAAALMF